MDESVISFTRRIDKMSTQFEQDTSELKKKYLLKNIFAFNFLAEKVSSYRGCFGTGYPFYALRENFKGKLPVIEEQIRYNRELSKEGRKSTRSIWTCRGCLEINYKNMPDLKQICKPCPSIEDSIKPRKVINRLPDMDMWLICEDGHLEEAERELELLMDAVGFKTSDIDPMETIDDFQEIVEDLQKGNMPKKYLPIDVHIMEYSQMKDIIANVSKTVETSALVGNVPYIPIHPMSLRKKWQKDDEAYNYIYDFLAAFNEHGFTDEMQSLLDSQRHDLASTYSDRQLCALLTSVSSKTQRERFKNPTLRRIYVEKINKWRTLKLSDPSKGQSDGKKLILERDI